MSPFELALKAGVESHDWGMFESSVGDVGEAVEEAVRIALESLRVGAVGRVSKVLMADSECSYPLTQDPRLCVCDVHGEQFEDMTVGDVYGHIAYMGGVCPVSRALAENVVSAVFGVSDV